MLLFFFLLLPSIFAQGPSPCPDILTYEPRNEEDRWYGEIKLRTREELSGVWIHIVLDRAVDVLGNWFGETTTRDNTDFTIKNSKYVLEVGPPVSIRFFVKYNAASVIPSVTTIRLNGKVICSARRDETTTTKRELFLSKPIELDNQSNGGSFRPNRPSSEGSRPSRPNNSGLTPGVREPDFTSSGNSRPSTSRPITSRPVTSRPITNRPNTEQTSNGIGLSQTGQAGVDYFAGDFAQILNPSQNKPPPSHRPIVGGGGGNSRCGTVATAPVGLISYGQNTSQGQWPWHAALYHVQEIKLMYTCGGTLISDRHILTAAHCVVRPQTRIPIEKDQLLVYLGKYNLKKFGSETQEREVSQIHVHPNFNASLFFNDISVLELSIPVEFTNYVRPCCLWEGDTSNEEIIGKLGTVVGWGFDENKQLNSHLMQAQMPVVSAVTCIYSNREFFSQFSHEKNYCAGFRNGTSVCNGDSGGGMVFPKPGTSGRNTVWQIRGLVSVGVALQGQGICDSSQYILFTDVAKHNDWIKSILQIPWLPREDYHPWIPSKLRKRRDPVYFRPQKTFHPSIPKIANGLRLLIYHSD